MMREAMAIYRERFRPSAQLAAPYVMLGVNVFAAETDAEARLLFSSLQQSFVNLRRGRPGPLPPPIEDMDARLDRYGARHAGGTPWPARWSAGRRRCGAGWREFVAATGADELMVTAQILDHAARKRSFEILAGLHEKAAVAA